MDTRARRGRRVERSAREHHLPQSGAFFLTARVGAVVFGVVSLAACSSGAEGSGEDRAGSPRQVYGDYVLEHRQWEESFVGCLRDAGLNPREVPGGGWQEFSVPNRPSQGGLDAECLAVAGPVPLNPPFDQGMLEDMYAAELRAATCLREHGYPAAEPSSKEAFVGGYQSDEGPPWLAHSEVFDMVSLGELQNEVLRDCPQLDPWELFAPEEEPSASVDD